MKKNFLQRAPICCNIGILLDLFRLYPNVGLHVDNTQEIQCPRTSLARALEDRRKPRMSVFPPTENPAEKNSVGRDGTSRPLAAETLGDLPGRRQPPPFSLAGRWTQTTIYSRASHTISISGPTHFPFLGSRAAHFPDVPPVPAVKCQYGTYPRTKASLVRRR